MAGRSDLRGTGEERSAGPAAMISKMLPNAGERRFKIGGLYVALIVGRDATVDLCRPCGLDLGGGQSNRGQALLQNISQIDPIFGAKRQCLLGDFFTKAHFAFLEYIR